MGCQDNASHSVSKSAFVAWHRLFHYAPGAVILVEPLRNALGDLVDPWRSHAREPGNATRADMACQFA